MKNTISVITPYWLDSKQAWVFDDDKFDLVQEPFISGIPEMIDLLTGNIENAKSGFRLIFSSLPFPDYQHELTFLEEEYGGSWYRLENGMKGWLCAALFHYFDRAPTNIFIKIESL